MTSHESPATCVYRQIFKVTNILGGFSSFTKEFALSTFDTVECTDGFAFTPSGPNIIVTTANGQSTFHQAVLIFREKFTSSAGVEGCSREIQYVEETPIAIINDSNGKRVEKIALSIGTLLIVDHNKIITKTVKLVSYSEQLLISRFLHTYITEQSGADNMNPCNSNVQVFKDKSGSGFYSFFLSFDPYVACGNGWFVGDQDATSSISHDTTSVNHYTIYGNGGLYRIGYTINGSPGTGSTTYYSLVPIPLPTYNYEFIPDQSFHVP